MLNFLVSSSHLFRLVDIFSNFFTISLRMSLVEPKVQNLKIITIGVNALRVAQSHEVDFFSSQLQAYIYFNISERSTIFKSPLNHMRNYLARNKKIRNRNILSC